MELQSYIFDNQLSKILHYQKYPEMMPWVGCYYVNENLKILLIGESHYLKNESNYHHDPIGWYEGVSLEDKDDRGWVITRSIILNGINSKWKSRSKSIYRNTEKALIESNLIKKGNYSPPISPASAI
jgi:hypothetical protein